MSDWSTPDAVRTQLARLWDQGRLLSGELLFPLRLSLRGPKGRALGERFAEVRSWVQQWQQLAEERGLELEWQELNSREVGRNRLPTALLLATRDQALGWLGKRRAAAAFSGMRAQVPAHSPAIDAWLLRRPLQALALEDAWPRLLAILEWVKHNPRPGIYLRQLDLPGVDTKFIETHRKVLSELLDAVLPPEQVDGQAVGSAGFAQRYGFIPKPVRVRFRLLDPALYLSGLSDLELPMADFAALQLPVQAVFVTENEINGLAFPPVPGALVIFGLGYRLDSLRSVLWLRRGPLYYWGDLDTHGFAMLDQLRSHFPAVQSLLMDRETLLAHRAQWGREPAPARRELSRLTAEEQALYEEIRDDRLAPALRLEQERIAFGWLQQALDRIADRSG